MKIDHIVVLMLENRSFDHLFGYLDHPDPAFPNLGAENHNQDEYGVNTRVSDTGSYTLVPGPGHHHSDVMEQLYDDLNPLDSEPNNSGFAKNYAKQKKGDVKAIGGDIMRCLNPKRIPILSALAKEYCICTRWFSSVPGATWPNRQFVHAATSHKKVDNKTKFYSDPTVFELLSKAAKSWSIFHDGIAQSFAFKNLWDVPLIKKKKQFRSMKRFYEKARSGTLPNYSFIEPNHMGSDSNSLHPGYIEYDADAFIAGEELIATVYAALTNNFEVWKKTLFIITFDEHGGFYDSEMPPKATPPEAPSPADKFKFDRLGVRVPAILISPWINRGTIDDTVYDHSSIIKTLRTVFAPESAPLTNRDRDANHVLSTLLRSSPRLDSVELPPLPHRQQRIGFESERVELDEFQESLLELGELMQEGDIDLQEPFLLGTAQMEVKKSIETLSDLDAYQDAIMKKFRQ